MAYLSVAVRCTYFRKESERKERGRSVLCNHTDSSIFNLNKILFIRIAGNNCDLKMYLAQRNVALKLNEVNFFNVF